MDIKEIDREVTYLLKAGMASKKVCHILKEKAIETGERPIDILVDSGYTMREGDLVEAEAGN